MRAHERFSVLHKDDLLHLRKVVQAMGNQKYDLILGIGLKIGKNDVLRASIQRGEGIV